MFNVAIVGAELFDDYDFCQEKCIKCLSNKAKSGESITIFSQGDKFVDTFANKFHINVHNFYTNWKDHGKNALKLRNEEMLQTCNALIAFDNNTKDIKLLYDLAISKNIPVRFFKK